MKVYNVGSNTSSTRANIDIQVQNTGNRLAVEIEEQSKFTKLKQDSNELLVGSTMYVNTSDMYVCGECIDQVGYTTKSKGYYLLPSSAIFNSILEPGLSVQLKYTRMLLSYINIEIWQSLKIMQSLIIVLQRIVKFNTGSMVNSHSQYCQRMDVLDSFCWRNYVPQTFLGVCILINHWQPYSREFGGQGWCKL